MTGALSNPTIEVNDQTIAIVPNSTSYKVGAGDVNVRTQSSGGGSTSTVITEDAETRISMVKFSLYVTDANAALIRGWQENRYSGGNTIKLSQRGLDVPLAFINMHVTTDPEYTVSADGTVEIEFMGDAA